MRTIPVYDSENPIILSSDITEETIAMVYKEENNLYGKCIVAICLRIPLERFQAMLRRLEEFVATELVNILLTKTRQSDQNFIMTERTADGFTLRRNLDRNDVEEIGKFKWMGNTLKDADAQIVPEIKQEAHCFKSLTQIHGITIDHYEYKACSNY